MKRFVFAVFAIVLVLSLGLNVLATGTNSGSKQTPYGRAVGSVFVSNYYGSADMYIELNNYYDEVQLDLSGYVYKGAVEVGFLSNGGYNSVSDSTNIQSILGPATKVTSSFIVENNLNYKFSVTAYN